MADMDDGPEQVPLPDNEVKETMLRLLPSRHYDLILTHGFWGEYTRHVRHEEVSRAVIAMRRTRRWQAHQVLRFAYDDESGMHLPCPDDRADIKICLSDDIWQRKREIITKTYGFAPNSWEARTTPKGENYWEFSTC
jgi:hypothetical protein